MPSYRVRMTIEVEVPVDDADSPENAFRQADAMDLFDIGNCHWMINKQIEVVGEAKPQEQSQCDFCGSNRWDDYKGCAACGNLNSEWMG